jgi:hypothetical protein
MRRFGEVSAPALPRHADAALWLLAAAPALALDERQILEAIDPIDGAPPPASDSIEHAESSPEPNVAPNGIDRVSPGSPIPSGAVVPRLPQAILTALLLIVAISPPSRSTMGSAGVRRQSALHASPRWDPSETHARYLCAPVSPVRRSTSLISHAVIVNRSGRCRFRSCSIIRHFREHGIRRGRLKLFFPYARDDEPILSELEKHLAVLSRAGLIETWKDRDIGAGQAMQPMRRSRLPPHETMPLPAFRQIGADPAGARSSVPPPFSPGKLLDQKDLRTSGHNGCATLEPEFSLWKIGFECSNHVSAQKSVVKINKTCNSGHPFGDILGLTSTL